MEEMGMIIIWGWELVFSLLSSLLARLVRRLDMYICTTLRSNPVICIINIDELHLPILCYVGQYLTKERGICLLLLWTKNSVGFILHTCAPKIIR